MSVLGTGITGLLAFQRALATTSHNIANAATEGYSRQQVDFAANTPQRLGSAYVGSGVQITGIRRLQSDLVDAQLRTNLTSNANGQVRAAFAERLDRLLADETTGVMPTLESFFASTQDVASDPTSLPERMVMLNEAETLVGRFAAVNNQIEEQRNLVNGQIKSSVSEINQYAQSIADINGRIVARSNSGSPPNDLLDQRDFLFSKLSEKVDLSLTRQDDGAVNVFIGNGQALVMGGSANQLVTSNFSGDPLNPDIGISTGGGPPANITRFMTGGEIGGLLETRTNLLNTSQNELGLISLTLATKVNEQNGLGLDLDGELGQNIFKLPDVVVNTGVGNDLNRGSPSVEIDKVNVTQLTSSDYRLSHNGTEFQLTRLSDNQLVTSGLGPLVGDGLRIDTASITAPVVSGDNWLIQPTRFAASRIEVEMKDPAKIAAASGALAGAANKGEARLTGLRADPALATPDTYLPAAVVANPANQFNLVRPSYGTNVGGATVEAFRVLDPKDAGLLTTPPTPVTQVTFDTTKKPPQFVVGDQSFSLDPSGTTTITANGWELKVKGTPDNGTAFEINVEPFPVATPPASTTINGPGWDLDIRGEPAENDIFTVDLSKNSQGDTRQGDNRNMLAMSALQDARVVNQTTVKTTFQASYNTILSDVGTETRRAQITRDSSATLLASAQEQRESISGVNLDEEAANLIRFQQAYQAAAQVISVSNTMFDTLLNALR